MTRVNAMNIRIHDAVPHAMPHMVVPGSQVRQSEESVPVGEDRHPELSAMAVQLVTEGDVVRAIDVTCGCGQKARVWCVYESE